MIYVILTNMENYVINWDVYSHYRDDRIVLCY